LNKNEKAEDTSNGILRQRDSMTLSVISIIDRSMIEKLIQTLHRSFSIGGVRKDNMEEFRCILIRLIDNQVMQASTEIRIIVRAGIRIIVGRGDPGREKQST
jgi:hypothetical protein